ncbi:MAG: HEAT repeat domain-containing protein [Bradymonadia bacterium]
MAHAQELEQIARERLLDAYGPVELPEGVDVSQKEWSAALVSVLTSNEPVQIVYWSRVTALVEMVGARHAHTVLLCYHESNIFPRWEIVEAIARFGEAALDGLEGALESLPEEWGDRETLGMSGGNTSEHFEVYQLLCFSVMELYRRMSRAPSDSVRAILEGFIANYTFNGFQTHERRLEVLERVRDMAMCLSLETVTHLTMPGEGPVNWDTVGFVPDEARAGRVVEELIDKDRWQYTSWDELVSTAEGGSTNRIAETFALLGGAAVPALAEKVGKGSAKTRMGLVCALGFTDDDAAIPELARALGDGSARVREMARTMLLRFDHDAVRVAVQPLTSSRKSAVAEVARVLLAQLD